MLSGKIAEHRGRQLTVAAEQNIVFRVLYDEKTEIRKKDGTAAKTSDLKVGKQVNVQGELTEDGRVLARKIVIL